VSTIPEDNPWNDHELIELAKRSSGGRWPIGALTSDPELLSKLAESPDFSFSRGAVGRNLNTPVPVLVALSHDDDEDVRRAVAGNPNTPADALDSLARDPRDRAREAVARNSGTQEPVLEILSRDGANAVRAGVAKNPNTPIAILQALSGDQEKSVRREVAQNITTPVSLLETLSEDEEIFVQGGVAINPQTPQEILQNFAKASDKSLRMLVARNGSTPVAVLETLAEDADHSVRGGVGQNPNAPIDLLEKLAQDSNRWAREPVAKNVVAPLHILQRLAQDPVFTVRMYVAGNPNLSTELFHLLAKDKASGVREMLAMNAACPGEVLLSLAADPYGIVQDSVLGNGNSPIAALRQILETLALGDTPDGSLAGVTDGLETGQIESAKSWEVAREWHNLDETYRERYLLSHPSRLLDFWREYFEVWSTQDLGDEEEAFSPLVLGAKLGIEGADELLELVESFELSDRLDDTRSDFEFVVDEVVEWITEHIPVRPEGFGLPTGSYSIDNDPDNLALLKGMDKYHVWSVRWADVPCLVESFYASTDPFSIPNFYVTDHPHVDSGDFVCDLAFRLSCLLCDGEGESEEGAGCPACEEGGSTVVDVTEVAFRRGRDLLSPSLRVLMG